MIYTVTFNPAIDYTVELDKISLGETNRSKYSYILPGGKGINVSRVLNNLDIGNIALGFVGGFTGKFVEDYLKAQGLVTDFVYLEEDTRINVKIKTTDETEINASGPNINEKDLEEFYKKLNRLKQGDYLILAGNVQDSLPRDTYSNIQKRCASKGVKTIVDTTREALTLTLENKPFLLKPNLHELESIFDIKIRDKSQAIIYAKKLIEKGAQNIIVSMGGEGALFVSKEKAYFSQAPQGILKNSVGAGDSMVAGFLAKFIESEDSLEAFKYSVAAGSATAFSKDLCTKEEVEELFKKITFKEIF
ncbi:1-phosphofructokinase [Tissierella creatinophila]|uniref:Tagatose-6-phosphate kinase n=1 Tax=Tissierella creatinophila DSM 6911 TaxID=1123403 RepID=A0A1U7M6S4_TISCR|nr:1-phosphofructokinase [Tissierella creatinophila]OLS02986.1 tagatose-6-phosphate kinase [Tissierella creatinophila DSM 6911]